MSYVGQETTWIAATNAVLHDAEHASALILPVVAK
jgi:hypothetical protein